MAGFNKKIWIGLLILVLLSPLASANPDGLNRVAMDLGFIATAHAGAGPLAGYRIGFIGNAALARIAAGAIGLLVVLGLAALAGRALQKRS